MQGFNAGNRLLYIWQDIACYFSIETISKITSSVPLGAPEYSHATKKGADEMKCIYCDAPLDNSDEHILQQGFGSTLSSREIICSGCNALFSNALDSHCVSKFDLICNQLGISGKPKKGGKSNPGKAVKLKTEAGVTIVIDRDQRIASQDKPIVNQLTDESGNLTGFEISGTDFDAIKSVMKSISKGQPKTETLTQSTKNKIISEKVGALVSSVTFDNLYFKGIKKSLINFIAYHDRLLLKDNDLDACAKDVYIYAKTIKDNKTPSDGEAFYPFFAIGVGKVESFLSKHVSLSTVRHNLLVSCNKEDQSIIGVVILFNQFMHAYLLSETFCGDSETFLYSHSPLATDDKTALADVDWPLLKKDDLIKVRNGSKQVREHLKNAYMALAPEMWQSSNTAVLLRKIENIFSPLPFPTCTIKEAEEEIVEASERLLILLGNIELGSVIQNDPLLEVEIHKILKSSSRTIYKALVKQHGDKLFNDNIAQGLGVNIFNLFSQNISPLFRKLLRVIKSNA